MALTAAKVIVLWYKGSHNSRSYPGRNRRQLSFVCSSQAEADVLSVATHSCCRSTVGQAEPSRRQKRVSAYRARTQISPPGENRYTAMAGRDNKFGQGASGSSTPVSAGQGNQRTGRQSPNTSSFTSIADCASRRVFITLIGILAVPNYLIMPLFATRHGTVRDWMTLYPLQIRNFKINGAS